MVSWTRGQLPASVRYLCERWQWSNTKVSTFIRLLEKEQMIERLNVAGQTVFSLKNYETYNVRQQKRQLKEPVASNRSDTGDSKKDSEATAERQNNDEINIDNIVEEDIIKFLAFQKWILKNTPRVAKMTQPFTMEQFIKLRKLDIPKESVSDILFAMENYTALLKNRSAYLTLFAWAKKRGYIKSNDNATTEYLRKRQEAEEQVRKRAAE